MSKERIKYLSKKIIKARQSYYNGQPEVSDKTFDAWYDELKKLAPDHPAVTGVGALPVSEWPKVNHAVPMQSLNKAQNPDDIKDWAIKDCNNESDFIITEKLDGISVSLEYNNGKLIQGSTRGNGAVGEDITPNVIKMKGVKETLNTDFTGYIRGEIVLRISDHKKYFSDYSNPRNAASGIAKRYDGDGAEHLTVLCYTVNGKDFKTEEESLLFIKEIGLDVPNYSVVKSIDDVIKEWNEYQKTKRNNLDYDIDGLVVRVNNMTKQIELGDKNHRPKGAIAFKFDAPTAETIITNILVQVGDSGRLTPVALFNKVDLAGAKIQKASLHNFSNIKSLGVDIGATVIVSRRNDVIPYVEEVVKGTGTTFSTPDKCPECNSPTIANGEYVSCSNKKTCPAQVIGRINKWVSELNILEWGEKVLKKLISAGLVTDVADIYRLTEGQLASLDRMGDKSAANLIAELNKYRSVSLENLIGGLAIENVATSTVKLVISAGYDTLDKIKNLSISKLENINGFGEIKAAAFYYGLQENSDRIQDILDAGVTIKQKVVGNLSGKSFCFTGTSSMPRKELHKLVEEHGGEVKKSVGKGLTYLVSSDPDSNSSKAVAARKNGTKIITEEEFMKMI